MDPLILADGWTLESIEQSMRRVVESGGAPLQVNKEFVGRRKGALHDAARLQLLATWARLANDRRLQYHAANQVQLICEELCDYAPGIAALRLCDGITVGEQFIPRREALEPAAEKMASTDQLLLGRIVRGRTIDFTCVSGSKIQYLRPLFTVRNSSAVKRKEGMFFVLKALSNFVAKSDENHIPHTFLESCAVFASELMKNTQQHATRDHAGQPYLEHVEGLIISWQEMLAESFKGDFAGHPRLKEFWEREQVPVRSGATTALRCLQLSFFDTGPGFASRATGKHLSDLSLEDERKALLESLRKNVSTKNEVGAGNGLPDVLEALREVGGLMTIRTGRLSLFNAFMPGEGRDLFEFDDWATHDLAPAAGSVVSLLLPIRR